MTTGIPSEDGPICRGSGGGLVPGYPLGAGEREGPGTHTQRVLGAASHVVT
jgi:hypothetical protein